MLLQGITLNLTTILEWQVSNDLEHSTKYIKKYSFPSDIALLFKGQHTKGE